MKERDPTQGYMKKAVVPARLPRRCLLVVSISENLWV